MTLSPCMFFPLAHEPSSPFSPDLSVPLWGVYAAPRSVNPVSGVSAFLFSLPTFPDSDIGPALPTSQTFYGRRVYRSLHSPPPLLREKSPPVTETTSLVPLDDTYCFPYGRFSLSRMGFISPAPRVLMFLRSLAPNGLACCCAFFFHTWGLGLADSMRFHVVIL